jgi:RimJ/RimL family protein N-acetyltransferase
MLCLDSHVVGPWVCQRAGGNWVEGSGAAIGWVSKGRLVAGVLYCEWNGANVICHMAGEGNFLTRKYLYTIFDYPFNQLKVKRVTLPIASTNKKAIRFVKHLGFTLESTLQDAHPNGDLLLFKMHKADCRWLGD